MKGEIKRGSFWKDKGGGSYVAYVLKVEKDKVFFYEPYHKDQGLTGIPICGRIQLNIVTFKELYEEVTK